MSNIWNAPTLVKKFGLLGTSLINGHANLSQVFRSFSVLTTKITHQQQPSQLPPICATTLVPSRGLKVKARVYHRCRKCYFQYEKGILYNLCRAHGRHQQMLKPKYWSNQRIMTEVSQTPKKLW